MIWVRKFLGGIVFFSLVASCGGEHGVHSDKNTSETGVQGEGYGYYQDALLWDKKEISICWEWGLNDYLTEKSWVQSAVRDSWGKYSSVRFVGWENCTNSGANIRIQIKDVGPSCKEIGKELNQLKNGMSLNFTYYEYKGYQEIDCAKDEYRENCIRNNAIHEFGHALGINHEQNRPDKPADCTKPSQGANGDTIVGYFDHDSIMNYCNEWRWINPRLSMEDIRTIRQMYPKMIAGNFSSKTKSTLILKDGDGIHLVEYINSRIKIIKTVRYGQRIDNWLLRENNHIEAVGDFDADGYDDLIIRSPWGIGIVTYKNNAFHVEVMHKHGVRIPGGWLINEKDRIDRVGDFDGYNGDQFIIRSDWGIGIIEKKGNGFYTSVLKANGTRINGGSATSGSWLLNQNDRIEAVGNVDSRNSVASNSRIDEFFIWSQWGMGLIRQMGKTFQLIWIKPFGSSINGNWVLSDRDRIAAVGSLLHSCGADQFILRNEEQMAIGKFDWKGNLEVTAVTPYSSWIYSWYLTENDIIEGVGNFGIEGGYCDNNFLISSNTGFAAIKEYGGKFRVVALHWSGYSITQWFYKNDHKIVATGDFNGNKLNDFLISGSMGYVIVEKKPNEERFLDYGMTGCLADYDCDNGRICYYNSCRDTCSDWSDCCSSPMNCVCSGGVCYAS